MGLKDLKILFDDPRSTYYGGQSVTGRVVVALDAPKKIRGINIKIKGEANTSWSLDDKELNNEGRYETESRTVSAHEEYFNVQYYLVGSSAGGEVRLASGEHAYPFNYVLPPNIPSSFESDYGHVRYTVKAILDRPWKFDHAVKIAFTVVSPFDLNQEPGSSEPVQVQLSKTFRCLCCASAPLNVNVSLPVRGYVPGQAMPIRVNVENLSGVTVDVVKFVLRKVVAFHVNVPRQDTKRQKIIVVEVSRGPIEGGASANYEQRLDVPPLPPSNLTNCSIIDLEYNLKIEACVSGWYHRNLKTDALVFVGTIPLRTYQTSVTPPAGFTADQPDYPTKRPDPTYGGYPSGYPAYAHAGDYPSLPAPTAPDHPADAPLQFSPTNLYPDLPPPSYEESMYAVQSIREHGESEYVLGLGGHFAPRYPVYNFALPK